MADFNANIGQREADDTVAGGHELGQRNERGHRRVESAECTNMYIINTFFKRNSQRKWTWRGSNGTENVIDYILVNKHYTGANCKA